MRHIRLSLILLLIIISSGLSAQTKPYSFKIKPYLGMNTGKTEYIMDLKYPSEGTVYFIKSQLEFPVDQTMFGGEVEFVYMEKTKREWAFNLGYYTNINDPIGKMYDHDWWNLRTGIDEKFSYTESDVEAKNNIFLVETDKLIILGEKGNISFSVGFKYQKIEQDIFGFAGWQIDQDGVKYEFAFPDTNGLYYKIIYKLPNIGFRINYLLSEKLTLISRLAYTRAFISDFDDHLLRYKTTESDIIGNGLLADFSFYIDLDSKPGRGLFVELKGDLTYINASGSSTQSWYGDDPSTEDDETGLIFTGLPHEINTTQFQFGVVVGLGF